jgi:hypothetical protein
MQGSTSIYKEIPWSFGSVHNRKVLCQGDTEMKRKSLSKMAEDIMPMPSDKMPSWKNDSNLMGWLKSLG